MKKKLPREIERECKICKTPKPILDKKKFDNFGKIALRVLLDLFKMELSASRNIEFRGMKFKVYRYK